MAVKIPCEIDRDGDGKFKWYVGDYGFNLDSFNLMKTGDVQGEFNFFEFLTA